MYAGQRHGLDAHGHPCDVIDPAAAQVTSGLNNSVVNVQVRDLEHAIDAGIFHPVEGSNLNMALIKCSECKGSISESAQVCPHCGQRVPVTYAQYFWWIGIGLLIIVWFASCS